jgi:hypothetical protein
MGIDTQSHSTNPHDAGAGVERVDIIVARRHWYVTVPGWVRLLASSVRMYRYVTYSTPLELQDMRELRAENDVDPSCRKAQG